MAAQRDTPGGRPPHPATVRSGAAPRPSAPAVQPHPATTAPAPPPHPATVAPSARSPHPATVVQPRADARGMALRRPHAATLWPLPERRGAGAVQRMREPTWDGTFIAVDSLAEYIRWAEEHKDELRLPSKQRLWAKYGPIFKELPGDKAIRTELDLLGRVCRKGKGTIWDEVANVDDLFDKLESLYSKPSLSTLIITGHANESVQGLGQGSLDVDDLPDMSKAVYEGLQLYKSEIKKDGLSFGYWPTAFKRLAPIACAEGQHRRFYVFLLGCNAGGPPPTHASLGNWILNLIADTLFNNVFKTKIRVGVFGASLETDSRDTERILQHIDQIKAADLPWFNTSSTGWGGAPQYQDGEPGLYAVFRG